MQRRPICIAVWFGLSLAASMIAKERTLTFDDGLEIYTLTFDESQLPEQMLRQLAWLSSRMPEVAHAPYESAIEQKGKWMDKVFTAPQVEQCLAYNSRYRDCAKNRPGTAVFFHNAGVNIARGEEEVQRLSNLDTPSELNPVKQYLLTVLERYLSVQKAKLAYYKSWDLKILQRETEKICGEDPNPELLKTLSAQRDHTVQYRLAQYDWYSEMNSCIAKGNGSYPLESWAAFLKAHGITEHYRVRRVD